MSEAKHTPGPWEVVEDERTEYHGGMDVIHVAGYNVYAADGTEIVGSEGILPGEVELANAYLIAAAPNLLAAAQKVLNHLDARINQASSEGSPVPIFEGIADLHAAIAKAQGE